MQYKNDLYAIQTMCMIGAHNARYRPLFMPKPNILLINPNTSPGITETIRLLAIDEVGDQADFKAVTAPFGARYISSRAAVTVAGHAVIDAYANAIATGYQPDGVIVACFGDPGLDALQELAPMPVMGFADQGLVAAAAASGTFAIATIGEAWRDMLLELVHRRGLTPRLGGIIVLDESARDPAIGGPRIDEAARLLEADRVIIGGTGLIPILDSLAEVVKLPVIDPHRAAFHDLLQAIASPAAPNRASAVPVIGLSAALARLFEGPANHDLSRMHHDDTP